MGELKSNECFDKDTILRDTLRILREMTSGWDMGFAGLIGPETRLGADLALDSMQMIELVIAMEEHFKLQELPFQQLFMSDDREADDPQVSELVDFLYKHLNNT